MTQFLIGVDEVGRGALAGDVFTCGVLAPVGTRPVGGVTDSKVISAPRREHLHQQLTTCPDIRWHIARRDASRINACGINFTVRECFIECIEKLLDVAAAASMVVTSIEVDGTRIPSWPAFSCPTTFTPKGDANVWAIGAASIIAKVERDAYMRAEAVSEPRYDWASNMGYGTPAHIKGLVEHGLTPLHRRQFCARFSPKASGEMLELLDLI